MADLPTSRLGRTDLLVTRLGYGAMELKGSRQQLTTELAGTILNSVLDAGINLIDTSPDYGRSEELIGKHISHRRDEFYIASKCGCLVGEAARALVPRSRHVFTRENIRAGVEQSLRRMRTDYLDIIQFHANPSRAVLEEHDAVETLRTLQREGKVRFLGMSGTLPHLTDHIAMAVFDTFQISYSALEREHEDAITAAARAGAGTIIRGGVARGAPVQDRTRSAPCGLRDLGLAFIRREPRVIWKKAKLDELLGEMLRLEFLLRFTLTHPLVHTTIVGTANLDHLADNVAAAQAGPLPEDVYAKAKRHLAPYRNRLLTLSRRIFR